MATNERSDTAVTDEQVKAVADCAREAREHAYAPYSDFPMGAAVMTTDGELVTGVLIENVSLGLAMCAERVAMFNTVTKRAKPMLLAICSKRTNDELTFPCGACLQVALEVSDLDLTIVAVDPDGNLDQASLGSLLTRAPKRHTPGS